MKSISTKKKIAKTDLEDAVLIRRMKLGLKSGLADKNSVLAKLNII